MGEPARRRGRDESELERVDRNMLELLNELRVALPGVQVLFAFLLVMPFNSGFPEITAFQRGIYIGTLLATALAAVLLIAPTMHHRLQFRADNKEQILRDSTRLTVAGMTVLAVAMCGAVVLITDFVFGTGASIAALAGMIVVFVTFWFAMPLQRLYARRRRGDREREGA